MAAPGGTPSAAAGAHTDAQTPAPAPRAQASAQASAAEEGEEEVQTLRQQLQAQAKVILGSSSISRQNILRRMGVDFTIRKAGLDEKAIRRDTPAELVTALAQAKAQEVQRRMRAAGELPEDASSPPPDAPVPLLITCDQVVVYQGRILEKPESPEEAKEWIQGYALAPACTVGATMVTNLSTGFQAIAVDTTESYFSEVPEASIDRMIKEGFVFYCAGGLMVEHALIKPHVTRMVGTMDAVMGLPIETTWSLLRQALHSTRT